MTQSSERLADIRRRQAVTTRQYGIAKQRRDAWVSLLKGIGSLSNAYNESDQLPDEIRTLIYDLARYGNETYGKLIDYLSKKDVELHDLDAKIRVSQEE